MGQTGAVAGLRGDQDGEWIGPCSKAGCQGSMETTVFWLGESMEFVQHDERGTVTMQSITTRCDGSVEGIGGLTDDPVLAGDDLTELGERLIGSNHLDHGVEDSGRLLLRGRCGQDLLIAPKTEECEQTNGCRNLSLPVLPWKEQEHLGDNTLAVSGSEECLENLLLPRTENKWLAGMVAYEREVLDELDGLS